MTDPTNYNSGSYSNYNQYALPNYHSGYGNFASSPWASPAPGSAGQFNSQYTPTNSSSSVDPSELQRYYTSISMSGPSSGINSGMSQSFAGNQANSFASLSGHSVGSDFALASKALQHRNHHSKVINTNKKAQQKPQNAQQKPLEAQQKPVTKKDDPSIEPIVKATPVETEADKPEFYCTYCSVDCGSEKGYNNHVRGMMHTNRVIEAEQGSQPAEPVKQSTPVDTTKSQKEKVPQRETPTSGKGKVAQGSVAPVTPSVNANASDSGQDQHSSSLRDYGLPTSFSGDDVKGSEFYCDVCETFMTCQKSFDEHMAGARHRRNKCHKRNGSPIARRRNKLELPTTPLIKETLDKCREPLIGMQHVTEHRVNNPEVEPRYVCNLCTCQCTKSLVPHCIGYKHRLLYLEQSYPDYYQAVKQAGDNKKNRTQALNEYAAIVEKEEGRQPILIKMEIDPFYDPNNPPAKKQKKELKEWDQLKDEQWNYDFNAGPTQKNYQGSIDFSSDDCSAEGSLITKFRDILSCVDDINTEDEAFLAYQVAQRITKSLMRFQNSQNALGFKDFTNKPKKTETQHNMRGLDPYNGQNPFVSHAKNTSFGANPTSSKFSGAQGRKQHQAGGGFTGRGGYFH